MKKILIIIYICLCGVSSVFADSINNYYVQNSLATLCISTKETMEFLNNSQNSKYIEAYNAVGASVKKHYGIDMANITHLGAFLLPSFEDLSCVAFLAGNLPEVDSWFSVVKAFSEDKKAFEKVEKFNIELGDKIISVFAFGDFVFLPVSNELMFVMKINIFKQIKENRIKFDKASENFKNLIESGKSFFIADKNWLDMLNRINQNAFSFMRATSKDSYIVWLNECLGDLKKIDFIDFTVTNDSAIMKLNLVNPEDVEVIKKGIEKKLEEKSESYNESFEYFRENNKNNDVYFFTNRITNSFIELKAKQYFENFKIDYEEKSVKFTFNYLKHIKQIEFIFAIYSYLTRMFDSIDSESKKICLANQESIISAVNKYNQEHNIAMSVVNIPLLVKLGYLNAPLEKGQCEWMLFKDRGNFGLENNYSIYCLKHGRQEPWEGEHISKRNILNQSECYKNQTELQLALFKYNRSDSGIMQELNIEKLMEKGFLDKAVVKPENGCEYYINHEVGENGCVQCKMHIPVFNQAVLYASRIASEKEKCFVKQKELAEAIKKYNSENETPMDKPDYYELEKKKYIESSWNYTMKSFSLCDICCEGNLVNDGYIYCKYHGSAFNDLKNPELRKDEDIEYKEPENIGVISSKEKKSEPIFLNAKDKVIAYAKKLYTKLPNDWKKTEYKDSDGVIHFVLEYREIGNFIGGRIHNDEWILDEITAKSKLLTEIILGEPIIGMSKVMVDFFVGSNEKELKKEGEYTDYIYEFESMKGYHTEFFVSDMDEVFMWCIELKHENQNKITISLEKLCLLREYLNMYRNIFRRYPHLGGDDREFDSTAYNAEEVLNWTDREKNVLTSNTYDPGFEIQDYKRWYRNPIVGVEPSFFMCDEWNNKIQYIAEDNGLWLWSYGPDGKAAGKTIAEAMANTNSDDIIISVLETKKKFF